MLFVAEKVSAGVLKVICRHKIRCGCRPECDSDHVHVIRFGSKTVHCGKERCVGLPFAVFCYQLQEDEGRLVSTQEYARAVARAGATNAGLEKLTSGADDLDLPFHAVLLKLKCGGDGV